MTAAPDPRLADGDAADRLDRAWDGFVRPAVHPGGRDVAASVDALAAVARLHGRDDAPPPDPGFAARLWDRLVAIPVETPATPEPGAAADARLLRLLPGGGHSVPSLLAAALVLAVLGGALDRGHLLPGFVAGSPTVAAHDAVPTGAAALAACPTPTIGVGTPPRYPLAAFGTATPTLLGGGGATGGCDHSGR